MDGRDGLSKRTISREGGGGQVSCFAVFFKRINSVIV